MIRRSTTLQNGSPGWLLVSQRSHAGLAAELACQWATLPKCVPPGAVSDLLRAIRHHDDGWDAWDRHWYDHLDHGVPIAFHEMDPAESNRIWGESIELAKSSGPLVTYLVARHFVRMRERSSSDDAGGASASFIDRNQRLCERSLRTCQATRGWRHADMGLVESAVDGLQFFDNLSLILCLGKVTTSIELTPPAFPPISLHFDGPWQIRFDPNPITTTPASLLQVEALEVPACGLDAKGLKRAAVPRRLSWQLSDEPL